MSRDILGNKQTIVLHNCLIQDTRYHFVITPHIQKVGQIRSKKQTKKRQITKQKSYYKKRYTRRVLELYISKTTVCNFRLQSINYIEVLHELNSPQENKQYM